MSRHCLLYVFSIPFSPPTISVELILYFLPDGCLTAALCLANFTLIVFAFGDGNLGVDSNNTVAFGSETVFKARSAVFATLTSLALILALELLDMRRSLFRLTDKPSAPYTQWARDIYSNTFLFWSVVIGELSLFPIIYIPVGLCLTAEIIHYTDPSFLSTGLEYRGVQARSHFVGVVSRRHLVFHLHGRRRGIQMGQAGILSPQYFCRG